MARLSVNVNKIATLRNSRMGKEPDLLRLTQDIVRHGAEGITIHPRADQRHITPEDVETLAQHITDVELNFEGDLREEFLAHVLRHKPAQCTLVPVKPGEVTSNHGWDLAQWGFMLAPVVARIQAAGPRVSLFMHPDDGSSLEHLAAVGADRVELYTEPYAKAHAEGATSKACDHALGQLKEFSQEAVRQGYVLNAGHDLTLANLPLLIKNIPEIDEVSIGHHLVAYALEVGLKTAVTDYLAASHGS